MYAFILQQTLYQHRLLQNGRQTAYIYIFLELRLPHSSLHRRDQVLKALEEFGDVNGTCFTEKY